MTTTPTTRVSYPRVKPRRAPRFELIAGNICLDFVNTLDDRRTEPKELLASYIDLVRFGEDIGLLTGSQVDRLFTRSYQSPDGAQDALRRARELREAIHDIFRAVIDKKPAPPGALGRLNADAQTANEHLHLKATEGGFEWSFDSLDRLDGMLWPLARAAADLLASDQLPLVRACSAKQCEWLFLDTSKNHQRRWCDMKQCGNRAKVQSFYARQRRAAD